MISIMHLTGNSLMLKMALQMYKYGPHFVDNSVYGYSLILVSSLFISLVS